jgi:hypothetical protein
MKWLNHMKSRHSPTFRHLVDVQSEKHHLLDDHIALISDDDDDQVFSMRQRRFEAIMSISSIS